MSRSTLPRAARRRAPLAASLALLGAAACTDDAPTAPVPLDAHPRTAIVAWNAATHAALTAHDGYANPVIAARLFAMVHAAQHDAVNAVAPAYARYAYAGRDADAHPVAAAAAAAHHVLVAELPGQRAALDAALAQSLADVPDGDAEARGVALGAAAGAAILAKRQGDGSDTPVIGDFVPGTEPGRYQVTPPLPFAHAPGWGDVRPFALASGAQFRVPAPPPLAGAAYAAAFDEVKRLGQLGSAARTAEQSAIAKFWYEFSESGWNRIAVTAAAERDLGLQSAARLLALVNLAMADGYIAGYESKYHHDFWRPITAIRAAATDGNAATAADPTWEPAEPTPPVPDYPSTHSVLGAAAAEVLATLLGDDVAFTFASPTAVPAGATRSFTSFRRAADENAESRVLAGIHFRFAADAGLAMGRQIGQWTVATQLRPR